MIVILDRIANPCKDNTPEKRVERIFQLMDKVKFYGITVDRSHLNFRTEMGVYRKKNFFKVQNKINQLFKLFHFTMVLFRFSSESTFYSMRHMIQPNMSYYVYIFL